MKTILVPTDFSAPAENAARYAFRLAEAAGANLTLIHAFNIVADIALASGVAWQPFEYQELNESSTEALDDQVEKLTSLALGEPGVFQPMIAIKSENGSVAEALLENIKELNQSLIVMGMSGAGAVKRLFLGSTGHDLIDRSAFPLLLIPGKVAFKPIHRIAYATDLSDGDIPVIKSIAGLATLFDADLVLANITDEWMEEKVYEKKKKLFLDKLDADFHYPKLYYRHIANSDIDPGLELLCKDYEINMLVMVHKSFGFFDRVFKGSHCQTLAKHISIPLMVIPEKQYPVFKEA